MARPSRPSNVEIIQCDVCMKEIPANEARSAEVHDYVMHFCGLDCYDQWQKQTSQQAEDKDTD